VIVADYFLEIWFAGDGVGRETRPDITPLYTADVEAARGPVTGNRQFSTKLSSGEMR
jgi:hypothetical protein